MAQLNVLTVVSFHKYNPDWEIVIYLTKQPYYELGKNIYVPNYTGKDYFYKLSTLDYVKIVEIDLTEWGINKDIPACMSSDIFRRKILYEQGGVYSDFDTVWLRPIEYLSNVDCIGNPIDFESLVCFYEFTHGFHNVSNLISEVSSLYVASLIEEEKKVQPPYGHQDFGCDLLCRKYPDWESVVSRFPRMLAIKYETFYPYSTYHMERLFIENDLTPLKNKNVMGIHWFNGNDKSVNYVNQDKFTDCSMTSILKVEGYI
jgi:hypothetical protein